MPTRLFLEEEGAHLVADAVLLQDKLTGAFQQLRGVEDGGLLGSKGQES